MVDATSSIMLGPLNRFATARFCTAQPAPSTRFSFGFRGCADRCPAHAFYPVLENQGPGVAACCVGRAALPLGMAKARRDQRIILWLILGHSSCIAYYLHMTTGLSHGQHGPHAGPHAGDGISDGKCSVWLRHAKSRRRYQRHRKHRRGQCSQPTCVCRRRPKSCCSLANCGLASRMRERA